MIVSANQISNLNLFLEVFLRILFLGKVETLVWQPGKYIYENSAAKWISDLMETYKYL